MPHYSDNELERLATDLESDMVERKESFKGDSPTKVREAVCAFANDLPDHGKPGIVVIGLTDDAKPGGLEISDELLRSLADIKTDGNILPPPTLTVEKRSVGGTDVAVITVFPSDSPPVRFKGRIWIRVGPRRAVASAQDERKLNERRRHLDRPADIRPVPRTTIDDLDLRRFEVEYLPAAIAPDVLEANDRTLEERLAATKMISSAHDPHPTLVGVLILGKDPTSFVPGAYVQFLRVVGTSIESGVYRDAAEISGTIVDVDRRLEEKIVAHNYLSGSYQEPAIEQKKSAYPIEALRQLSRNALLHRTYEQTNAPVRFTWYDDRIEIRSPGGPFGEVTMNNFGELQVTDYRNPNLAEAMKNLGLVQKFGSGIAIARSALERNGNPPMEFDFGRDGSYVLITVRHATPVA